jgi:hypothetical protein
MVIIAAAAGKERRQYRCAEERPAPSPQPSMTMRNNTRSENHLIHFGLPLSSNASAIGPRASSRTICAREPAGGCRSCRKPAPAANVHRDGPVALHMALLRNQRRYATRPEKLLLAVFPAVLPTRGPLSFEPPCPRWAVSCPSDQRRNTQTQVSRPGLWDNVFPPCPFKVRGRWPPWPARFIGLRVA